MSARTRFELSDEKRALMAMLLAEEGVEKPTVERIPRRREQGPVPLSFAQQRLWFLDRLVPGNPFYNCESSIAIRAPLDVDALQRALDALARRHDQLRASFFEIDGEPMQRIAESVSIPVERVDLRAHPVADRHAEARRIAAREAGRPFDLERAPLVRMTVVKLGLADHVLVLTMHHIISDGWSIGIFARELQSGYASCAAGRDPTLPALELEYADFAAWQRRWLRGSILKTQLDYWRERLRELSPLELPTDRPRPARPSHRGAFLPVSLPAPLTRGLRRLANQEGATLFVVLLAAFDLLLSRWSGQEDVAIGSPIANRNRAELEGLIGFFVNTLVLRVDLGGDPSFRELVGRVREGAFEAYGHQDLPFEALVHELQPEREIGRNPLVQVTFQLFSSPAAAQRGGNAIPDGDGTLLDVPRNTSKFDLRLDTWETPDGLRGQLEYATDLYDRATVERMVEQLGNILAAAVAAPDARLSSITLLSPAERREVLALARGKAGEHAAGRGVHEVFEALVARQPDAPALSVGDVRWSYAELDRRARAFAEALRAVPVAVGDHVAILLERGPEFVAAALGVLKAGASYVPLDPDYPAERLAFMLEDTASTAVVTSADALASLGETHPPLLLVEDVPPEPAKARRASVTSGGEATAYVMYTSGSTGRPKGVRVPHRAVNRLAVGTDFVELGPGDRVANLSSVSFDASTFEIFGTLLNGAEIIGIDRSTALSAEALRACLREERVTTMFVTTALFQQSVDRVPDCFATLRDLLVGGSLANPDHFRRAFAAGAPANFLHVYGPTENTTFSTAYRIESPPDPDVPLPIGRPIANSSCHVLDAAGQCAPIGVPGELHVGGAGVADGYLNLPGPSAERFVPDPFDETPGARLYRTGDRVRRLPSGDLVFLDRADRQIKVRGHRVELGEIDAVLAGHPLVREVVTTVRERADDDQRIVACVTLEDGTRPATADAPDAVPSDATLPDTGGDELVAHWREIYDDVLYAGLESAGPDDADRQFRLDGWISSYTGAPIPASEMREQVAGTVRRIASLAPARVLEIGVGTGLLLFDLLDGVERYTGTDLSAVALEHVHAALEPARRDKVTLLRRPADDFGGLEEGSVDVVVLNSTVQYFPDLDYLRRVLRGAARLLSADGAIFLGDLRSLDHLEAFHLSVELAAHDGGLAHGALARRVAERVAREQELAVSPAFFANVAREVPGLACSRLQQKRGRSDNELSRFRYDALLRRSPTSEDGSTASPGDIPWEDGGALVDAAALGARLASEAPERLALRGVPNARLAHLARTLEHVRAHPDVGVTELPEALSSPPPSPGGVHPEALWALEDEHPYRVTIFWSPKGDGGCSDVLLEREGATTPSPAFPPLAERRHGAALANNPIHGRFLRNVVPRLRQYLAERLPPYMLPAAYLPLAAFPLTTNGKVDVAALAALDTGLFADSHGPRSAPVTALERRVADIWCDVLGIDSLDRDADFFTRLGGHSLLATQVVSHVRRELKVEMALRTLFEAPTVAAFADAIQARLRSGADEEEAIRPAAPGVSVGEMSDEEVDAMLHRLL